MQWNHKGKLFSAAPQKAFAGNGEEFRLCPARSPAVLIFPLKITVFCSKRRQEHQSNCSRAFASRMSSKCILKNIWLNLGAARQSRMIGLHDDFARSKLAQVSSISPYNLGMRNGQGGRKHFLIGSQMEFGGQS